MGLAHGAKQTGPTHTNATLSQATATREDASYHMHLALRRPLHGEGFIAQNLGDKSRAVHGRVGVHRTDHKLQLRCNSGRLPTNGQKIDKSKVLFEGTLLRCCEKRERGERGQPPTNSSSMCAVVVKVGGCKGLHNKMRVFPVTTQPHSGGAVTGEGRRAAKINRVLMLPIFSGPLFFLFDTR